MRAILTSTRSTDPCSSARALFRNLILFLGLVSSNTSSSHTISISITTRPLPAESRLLELDLLLNYIYSCIAIPSHRGESSSASSSDCATSSSGYSAAICIRIHPRSRHSFENHWRPAAVRTEQIRCIFANRLHVILICQSRFIIHHIHHVRTSFFSTVKTHHLTSTGLKCLSSPPFKLRLFYYRSISIYCSLPTTVSQRSHYPYLSVAVTLNASPFSVSQPCRPRWSWKCRDTGYVAAEAPFTPVSPFIFSFSIPPRISNTFRVPSCVSTLTIHRSSLHIPRHHSSTTKDILH